jgi:outer membrane protein, heavy metal efflux system
MKLHARCIHAAGLLVGAVWLASAPAALSQDLDSLIRELLARNPSIQAARRSVDASRARIVPARTLPEPTVSFETMGGAFPPTLMAGDPSSARVLSFAQEIPYPGKLALQGQVAAAEADSATWKYEQVRRDTIAELKNAYYELYLSERLQDVLRKSKELLEQFVEISSAQYKVGKGVQQDVLKAQVEVSRLLDRQSVLERDAASAEVRINTLLYRSPETPIGRLPELGTPKLGLSLDQLYRIAGDSNPQVRTARTEIDRDELNIALAKKSFYPDFEVGFSYFNRRELPDMYGWMIRANVPLYFWRKQRPELEAATSDLFGRRREYDGAVATLYSRLKEAYIRASSDATLLDLYGSAIVPQATLALESSMSGYRVGTIDFLSLLSNQQTVLEYELKYYEVLTDYYKALVTLETLTGEKLTS